MIAGSRYPQGGPGGLYFIAIEMAPTAREILILSVVNLKEATMITVDSTFDPNLMKEGTSIEFYPAHSVIRLTDPDGYVSYFASGDTYFAHYNGEQVDEKTLDEHALAMVGMRHFFTTEMISSAFVFLETISSAWLDDGIRPACWAARRAAQWMRSRTKSKVEIIRVDVALEAKSITPKFDEAENESRPYPACMDEQS
jgi:hypothetical protein